MLEAAAKKNNIDAIKALAKCYCDGIGCLINVPLAEYWFDQLKRLYEKAIINGNIDAAISLGNLWLTNALGNIDFAKAEMIFIGAAKKKDIFAIFYLGALYLEGRLGNHSPAEGIFWIERAIQMWSERALQNDREAIESLIYLYQNKTLGFKNYTQVARWLSFIVNRWQDTAALTELLFLLLNKKINLTQDEAKQIFSQNILAIIKQAAIETKSLLVCWAFGELSNQGYFAAEEKNHSINIDTAVSEENLSAKEKNDLATILTLARKYVKIEDGTVNNLRQMVKWFCWASCLTPFTYLTNFNPNQDFKRILKYTPWQDSEKQAIVAGVLDCAQQIEKQSPYKVGRILGDIYRKGWLVAVDLRESFKWYELSASLENSKAMYCLGMLWQAGALGAVELDKAIACYEIAAQKDQHPKAIQRLKELKSLQSHASTMAQIDPPPYIKDTEMFYLRGMQYLKDNAAPQDFFQAAYWLRKGAKRQHAPSAFEVAKLYNSGVLGEKVRAVSIGFFKCATQKNHLGAMKALMEIYSTDDLVASDMKQVAKWQARINNSVMKV